MRFVIADDHAGVRKGVRDIIESQDKYVVCGEAADGLEAVQQTLDCNPDVVILDISMPLLNGLDAARHIHEQKPKTPIIILSVNRYCPQARSLDGDAGIKGYVVKARASDDLIQAIQTVAAGQTYFPRV